MGVKLLIGFNLLRGIQVRYLKFGFHNSRELSDQLDDYHLL